MTLILVVLLAIGGFVAILYGFVGKPTPVTQPIAFSHLIHLENAGLTCTECHMNAETHVFAGLPGKAVCLDCHDIDEEQGSHPEKDKLFAYDGSEDDIPWQRVAVTRPDVYFSHRRHVRSGKLDCLVCHVDQPRLDKPPATVRLVMSMTDCIECHKENGVSSDCLACHR